MYPYDMKKFAAEMEKLGWKKGDDGIYERNGEKFSFTIQVRDYEEERVDIANVVSHQLRQAGVDMKIALVTRFDWTAGYDGFLAGFAAEFDPDGRVQGLCDLRERQHHATIPTPKWTVCFARAAGRWTRTSAGAFTGRV